MATPPPFPPETFGTSTEPADYARAQYHYGPPRRPPSDLATQLREWVDVLARGRWFILAATLLVAIPVTAWVLLQPDQYEASARLYVETDTGGPLEGMLPEGGDMFGANREISNELYILQNAEDLSETVASHLLELAGTPQAADLTILETDTGEVPSAELLADRVAERVRVYQDGRGVNAVRVIAGSQEPGEAALIANLYAEAYVDRTQNSSRASVSASREFLESQADSVSAQLASREEATRNYMEAEGAVRLDEEASNIVSQLAALEAERDQARVEAGMASSRIAELRSQIAGLEANLSQRLGSGTERQLRQDEQRLATLRDQLETIYLRTPSLRTASDVPPEIAQLRRQVDTLEERVSVTSDRLIDESIAAGGVSAAESGLPRLSGLRDQLSEAEVSLRGLRSRIDILNGRIGSYQSELDRIPSQSVELARLMRERESAERLALGLDQRLQEARVAESAELGYAEVVRSADVPYIPVAPNRPRTIFVGLLLGLGLGVALAVGRARLDQSIRRPDHLRALGHPVLGVIPDTTKLIQEDVGQDEVEVQGWTLDSHLVTILNPMASASEAFRGLRTSVQFARPDSVVETLLVTSASPGEGKSTVAANLAVVMAQAGRKTLLVDADLRRPRVHTLFGMTRTPGLSDYLIDSPDDGVGSGSISERDLTVADCLDVLPVGNFVPNPAEYLGSRAFRDLLAVFREAYDVVILDAPPVMAATDPVLLSTQVDATILVAGAGQTKDFELQYAVDEIQAVGGSVAGVVLNRFDIKKEYGYRYQYAYRYGNKYAYGHENA